MENDKPIVEITWFDSKGVTQWEFWDDIEQLTPCIIRSVGYLIEDKDYYKTIALSISKDKVLGRLTIPTVCIKKMKILVDKENNHGD